MIDGLIPVSGGHSITRVIATIFIPQSFLKPEDTFDKVKDLVSFSTYQKKTIIKPTTISIKNNSLGVTSDQVSGFLFEEYDVDGRLKNIFKVENIRENQSVITLENRVYSNWLDFKERFINDVKVLSEKIDLYVDAISLTYVNEFRWIKSEKIDVNSIFNSESELLNKKFRDSKNGTLILISQGLEDKYSCEEKTEVSFNNDVKRIAMSHQYGIKLNNLELFNTINENKEFSLYYDKAYNANKEILFDVLSEESQKMINLKNK
ncbi:TIGR04255 family protein [Tenacibaculum maritimum]|uniref:TIGR04255 family protein n=1 Tax=Tenacibaculum maritimum TaxID=107401 RepID=UPI001330D26E|nr:TIGR04255 family protein [Tenacibaculum maritimum]